MSPDYFDIWVDSAQALSMLAIMGILLRAGRQHRLSALRGWQLILAGFGALTLASLLNLTDEFPALSRFVLIGNTPTEVFLEKIVGSVGGSVLLLLGLAACLPILGDLHRSRERLQRALSESEGHYRLLAEKSSNFIVRLGPDNRRVYVSPTIQAVLGYGPDELVGGRPDDIVHPDDLPAVKAALAAARRRGSTGLSIESRLRRKDGTYVWVDASLHRVAQTAEAGPAEVIAILRDIDARKQGERALRDSHERLRMALAAAKAGMWDWDVPSGRLIWSDELRLIYGVEPDVPLSFERWLSLVAEEDRERIARFHDEVIAGRRTEAHCEFRVHHPDLGIRWLASHAKIAYGPDGTPLRMIGLDVDVTERKAVEEALRASEEWLRRSQAHLMQAQAIAGFGSWEMAVVTNRIAWSAEMYRIFGDDQFELTLPEVFARLHPDDRHLLERLLAEAAEGKEPAPIECRIVRPDGELRHVRTVGRPVRSAGGAVERIIGTAQDITDLRRSDERRRELEHQLRQAQKMEAVGQLTGGIAHDFNNLLAVVIGNLDLAELDEGLGADTRELIASARDAGLRGAELTARLLAFSRRQPLQPRRIDLNAVVADHTRLLQRLLGRDVEIRLEPGTGLWPVELDPVQFETALTNLATNARDAMPQGGRLVVTTRNTQLDADYAASQSEIAPGDYVLVEIADTGAGMAPEVVERAFEPFFTTKAVGKGTGLGLSMVYGFIKQSGGHIRVYSEPGQGTTVRLYLPRAGRAAGAEPSPGGGELPLARGGETILAVEDDADVRRLLVRQLRSLGYAVTEAPDGPAALAMLEGGAPVDLLLTDIIMPGGVNGDELARRARALRPGLRVVFTSGFSAGVLGQRAQFEEQEIILTKPYRKRDLAEKVQAALRL